MIDLDQIIERIAAEANEFREEMLKLSRKEIYDRALAIHLLEEMTYLLCEYPESYEDDNDVLSVVDDLTADSGFLPLFLEWAMSQDSVDVTNTNRTYDALQRFCTHWLSEQEEGA